MIDPQWQEIGEKLLWKPDTSDSFPDPKKVRLFYIRLGQLKVKRIQPIGGDHPARLEKKYSHFIKIENTELVYWWRQKES